MAPLKLIKIPTVVLLHSQPELHFEVEKKKKVDGWLSHSLANVEEDEL